MVHVAQVADGLFQRIGKSPILSANDWSYPASSVSSPAATRSASGECLLLCRVDDYSAVPHLCAARSLNGISDWHIDHKPTFPPDSEAFPEEAWGVEDARISYLRELGKYAFVYSSLSAAGPCVSLALTYDFKVFERKGVVLHPDNKHAALFPRRINGNWTMINRPRSSDEADMWISESPDLLNWGSHRPLLRTRRGSWDQLKVAIGPPPIETAEGWLVLYYGAHRTSYGCGYHVGLALLDLDHPEQVIRRSKGWVFGHERDYEGMGDAHGIAFSCGTILEADGDTLLVYYGCATTEISVARASLTGLLQWLLADSANAA